MTLVQPDPCGLSDGWGAGCEAVVLSALPMGHAWRHDGLAEERVVEVARSLTDAPPVLVRREDHLVVDGAHRIAATRRLGLHVISVEWFEGDALDAAGAFIDRNRSGALPVTQRDREGIVVWVLASDGRWSDRRIASECGVSPKMVARLRSRSVERSGGGDRRIGRDGRLRPARPGVLREGIVDALGRDPQASLRTIASALGVSPETVRRVRRELQAKGSLARRPRPEPTSDGTASQVRLAIPAVAVQAGTIFAGGPASPRPLTPSWEADSALRSTEAGVSLVEWLAVTSVAEDCWRRAGEVPLGRVYEIADEARRRAACWASFAAELEARAMPQARRSRR